jgi:hypothetical protein
VRLTHSLLIALSLCLAGCEPRATPPAASSPGAAPIAMPASISPPAMKPADALASRNTNWAGVVADVTEFRRKGNVLTAVVRLRNNITSTALVQFNYREAYLMDEAGAKKYEVLKDEKDGYIAATPGGSVTEGIVGGGTLTLWMKFPAPPPEVKTATFAMPGMPPFEDLSIQDQ